MNDNELYEVGELIVIPTLALRGVTVFPDMTLHFEVERDTSMQALNRAMESGKKIFLVTQRDISVEHVEDGDLYEIGTISVVKQVLRLPGDNARVMVEGISRGRLQKVRQYDPYIIAEVQELFEIEPTKRESVRSEALVRAAYDLFQQYADLSGKITQEVTLNVLASREISWLSDFIAQSIPLRYEDKQSVLDELNPIRRMNRVNEILRREIQIQKADQEIQAKVQRRVNDSQREYYMREQIKVLQEELGEGESADDEIREYAEKIEKANLPEEVAEKLRKELKRMEKQPFGSAESGVLRNYLDVCLELPWTVKTKEHINVAHARKVLDADHYGMEKVKERILEFLAVKKLSPELRGQIICLVGPPGVGKTSIAASVAKALNRNMARVSLGGIRDEAEIRGHRKTYIGAMPGRIISAINSAGSANPLILLDEVDKLSGDYRGDPSSALLEVLDAEQNSTFRDHFLELPFDLSDVMFITTCNSLSTVPGPLRDRMEIIELSSYTDEEKLQIARMHLLPKEMKRHGLKGTQMRMTDDAIRKLITGYTKESGVRQLERELAALCRKIAMKLVSSSAKRVTVTADNLAELLGTRKYIQEAVSDKPIVGVVNGLAWTSVGGVLLEVEVNVMDGKGKFSLTGNLGDVMKESCQAAMIFIRSQAAAFGLEPDFYEKKDIFIHFPEGAVPKEGPSAGIAITTALVSALTGRPVRGGIAMTGEVSIRGRVMAIGGLREKTMAAYRNGLKTVIIPADNERDLEDIDQTVRSGLKFIPVSYAGEVIEHALMPAESNLSVRTEAVTAEAEEPPVDKEPENRTASEELLPTSNETNRARISQ